MLLVASHARSLISSLFVHLALGCSVALIPQIILLLKTRQVYNISIPLFALGLVGDVFTLLGLIVQPSSAPSIIIRAMYTICDLTIVILCSYYILSRTADHDHLKPPYEPETRPWVHALQTTLFVLAFGLPFVYWVSTVYLAPPQIDPILTEIRPLSVTFGWIGSISYDIGMLAQIWKNYKNRSVEGLSYTTQTLNLLACIFFAISMFVKSTRQDYLVAMLPFIFGAIGQGSLYIVMFVQFFFYRFHPGPPHTHYPLRDLKEHPGTNLSGATLALRPSSTKEREVHDEDGLDEEDEFDDIEIDIDCDSKKRQESSPSSLWRGKITFNVSVTPTSSPTKTTRTSRSYVDEVPIQGEVLTSPTPSYYHSRTAKARPKPLTLDLEKEISLNSPPPLTTSNSNPYSASSPTVAATPSYPCTPLTPYSAMTPHSIFSSSGSVLKQKDLHINQYRQN